MTRGTRAGMMVRTWRSTSRRSCSPISSAPRRCSTAGAGPLELSVGLDAGEPLPEGEDLYGTPVIVASRLCDAAGAGEILASEVVCRIAGPRVAELIQPAGALRLRGISERVAASYVRWREDAGGEEPAPGPAAGPDHVVRA